MKLELVTVVVLLMLIASPAYAASAKVSTHASANNGTAVASGEAHASDGGTAVANADAKAGNGGIAVADSKSDATKGGTSVSDSRADATKGGGAVAISESTSSDGKTVVSESSATSQGPGTYTGTSTVNGISSAMSNESVFEYVMNRNVPLNENTNILYLIIKLYNGKVIRNEQKVVTIENVNVENLNAPFSLPYSGALVSPDAHVDVPRLIDENTNVVITTYAQPAPEKRAWWVFW